MQWVALIVAAICLAYSLGTYLGLPLILRILVRLRGRSGSPRVEEYAVQIVIACFNEEERVRERIQNSFEQSFLGVELRVLVIDDGSTDDTVSIVSVLARENSRLELFSTGVNEGKNQALNRALQGGRLNAPILCFTDADSHFAPGALHRTVRLLQQENAGLAASTAHYRLGTLGGQRAESHYWCLENSIRHAEGDLGMLVSASGALIVMRREHLERLPPDANTDLAMPLMVLARGAKCVFADDAEVVTDFPANEAAALSRRRRTIVRALATLDFYRQRLPWRVRVILYWHKSARFYLGLPSALLFLLSVFGMLTWRTVTWQLLLWPQVLLYACAATVSRGPFSLPQQFVKQHGAALLAVWDYHRGRRFTRWTPPRG